MPSQLEMEVTEDLSVLMAKAERIMQDPAKVKYLAQRIKQVRQRAFEVCMVAGLHYDSDD